MSTPEPTASLGCLFVDERNGYIGIGRTKRYNQRHCRWFSIADIANPGLYCTKPRTGWNNRVLVDCEFVCDVPSLNLHIKKIIKTRIYCKHRPYTKNSRYEEWEEPGTISIMRGIITQAYINSLTSVYQPQIHLMEEKEKALCAFMLNENYTQEQLDARFLSLHELFVSESDEYALSLLKKYYIELSRTP